MQLIDQSGIAEFFSIQYGLRPRTEDAEVQQEVSEQVAAGELEVLDDPALFRRVAGLPREVQVPEGWPADWSRTHALATAIDVRGDQALVKVFPFEPTRAGAGLRGCWGVWSMAGSCRSSSPARCSAQAGASAVS